MWFPVRGLVKVWRGSGVRMRCVNAQQWILGEGNTLYFEFVYIMLGSLCKRRNLQMF